MVFMYPNVGVVLNHILTDTCTNWSETALKIAFVWSAIDAEGYEVAGQFHFYKGKYLFVLLIISNKVS